MTPSPLRETRLRMKLTKGIFQRVIAIVEYLTFTNPQLLKKLLQRINNSKQTIIPDFNLRLTITGSKPTIITDSYSSLTISH